jgi:predicted porin
MYAKYDAGFAKFAGGYQIKDFAADQYVVSVAVPNGNFTFGLDYMARNAQTFVATAAQAQAGLALSGTRLGDKASSAVGLGATYNFSKTTNLNASYITYTDAGVNVTGNVTRAALLDTEYRIRLLKSF